MSSKLTDYLLKAKDAYYAGNPILSDDQYDELELLCEDKLPIGSPKGRTEHLYKMYSLQKFYEGDDLPDWRRGKYRAQEIVTPKLDGAAVALRYLNGRLHSVVSRGDGSAGEDITHLFQAINPKMRIPKKIYLPSEFAWDGFYQITGEIVAPKTIKNARNYAAGALNLKDPKEFYMKSLEFFAYDLQDTIFETYQVNLYFLRDLGFNTPLTHSTDHIPQDGVVFRVLSNEMYKNLGFTSKYPRGAFALKERSEGIKTKILDVIWQTGKTGKVTPVALLEPIEIEGATVSRATLNNPGFIEALGIEIGDSVAVERAGGVIPRIIRKI